MTALDVNGYKFSRTTDFDFLNGNVNYIYSLSQYPQMNVVITLLNYALQFMYMITSKMLELLWTMYKQNIILLFL